MIHSGLAKACYAPADLFHEEALTLIRRARREDPARFARAVSSARALSETVYRDHPEGDCARRQEPLWSHISEAMRREGRPREAEQAAARALAASPGSYRARLAAALSAGGAGRADEAADRLEELRTRRPDRREARLWAAYWRAKAGPARAERAAR
ncbi:MAG TPA: hypothetical protein DCZ01_12560 [Elusimicrobia bacterium]|nr:MAG: hypothetical protein A2X37_04805 [Elusimicrobia bacterium GWA2_66_18]OGR71930.1 MAG: hypothetical protein A2X40_01620 [Elusimicrobia bacterium GWC2_65_9]HAZ09319.1 hypothetical protein [Elusimicrobiota bacterium]